MRNILHPAMNSTNFKGSIRENEGSWLPNSLKCFCYEIDTMNIASSKNLVLTIHGLEI